MLAKKWNFKRQEYEDYCREQFKFGECYCSKTIHNKSGFGYPVCEKCYNKELKNETL